ncbi:MAG TPA: flippase [Chloroflexota bacterium]|nr:flippase [Chloroflexota bacterium]
MAASVLVMALAAAALLRFRPGDEGSALHKVAKNSLFPMATSFLNKFLDLGFAVYMFRVLGPEGVGAYALAQVVLGYLDIVANFGLGTLLTREVAKDRLSVNRFLGNTLAVRVGLWLLCLPFLALLIGPGAGLMGITPEVALAIVLLVAGLLPSLVAGTVSALFQAYERFEYPAIVTVLTNILKIGLGVVALSSGWGFVGLAGVSVVVNLITVGMLFALMLALLVRPRWEYNAGFSWKLLGVSYPLMLNNLLNSVFYRVDSLMLTPMAGSNALGFYSTAYKFIDGLGIISSTFTMALFPLLSQYAHGARNSLARAYGLAIKLLVMASLPICVGTTLIAPQIILLFAGEQYLPHSAVALQILIWFLPFSFVNGVTQYLLIAINQQRFITLSFVVAALFNVGANLLLIPALGYVGAALTTVASELVLMVPFWYCVRRHVPPIPVLSLAWRPVVASAAMGLEVWLLQDWNLIAAIVLAVPIYGAGLLALGSFDKSERAMIGSMLPRRLRTTS